MVERSPVSPRADRPGGPGSQNAPLSRTAITMEPPAMLPRRETKPLEYAALAPMFGGIEKKPRLLDREVVTLGRARGSDICLDGNEVSALHCIIFRAFDGYRVRDCGS